MEDDAPWTVRLEAVSRLESEGIDGDDGLFSVAFEVSGPDVTASIEVLVSEVDDEAQVIAAAAATLRSGIEALARTMGRQAPETPPAL